MPAFKVMLAWVLFFFPGHKGNNHWLALFLKGKFLFNFFFLEGIVGGMGIATMPWSKESHCIASVCVVHTQVCFCVLVASCCSFLLLWDSPV